MKIWKMVSGIISMVLFLLVSLQSCAVGLYNTLEDNSEFGGSGGILLAIFMLTAGIVSLATHKQDGIGGDIAVLSLMFIAAFFGVSLAGGYSDLYVWSCWCILCGVLALVFIIIKSTKKKPNYNQSNSQYNNPPNIQQYNNPQGFQQYPPNVYNQGNYNTGYLINQNMQYQQMYNQTGNLVNPNYQTNQMNQNMVYTDNLNNPYIDNN